jgi:hypothetical protein
MPRVEGKREAVRDGPQRIRLYQVLYAVPSELIWLDPLWTSVMPGCV